MYTVHVAPVATEAQELGRARPSQRRAVKSADPDDVRACGSARIGALMQRPPPARRRAARARVATARTTRPLSARRRAAHGREAVRRDGSEFSLGFCESARIVKAGRRAPACTAPYAHMGAGDQPRRASENREIMRKIDIHPGGALLSHVQPFCAAPQSDLRAAAAPSRTQRQTTTRPRKRSNAQFLGEMPGQPPDTSTRPPKSRGSLTMRGTAGSRLSRTATALATLLHPPFPIGDPPIPRRA